MDMDMLLLLLRTLTGPGGPGGRTRLVVMSATLQAATPSHPRPPPSRQLARLRSSKAPPTLYAQSRTHARTRTHAHARTR